MVFLTLALLALENAHESSGSSRGRARGSAIQPAAQLAAARKPPADFSGRLNASFELGTPANQSIEVGTGTLPPFEKMMSSADAARLLNFAARAKANTGNTGQINIAVIGSSGNLLYRGKQNEIDKNDIVIRINGAPVNGYSRDVGRHSQICVGNDVGLHDARKNHMLGSSGAHFAAIAYTSPSAVAQAMAAHVEFSQITSEFIQFIHTYTLGTVEYPSTGFVAISMAVALAHHLGGHPVWVGGFGACLQCNKYYDCDGSNSSGTVKASEAGGFNGDHPFGTEAIVRKQWYDANLIYLKEPSCTGFPNYPKDFETSAAAIPERPGTYVEDP
jgi:hypothetical protein